MLLAWLWACAGAFPGSVRLTESEDDLFGAEATVRLDEAAAVRFEIEGRSTPEWSLPAGEEVVLPVRGLLPGERMEVQAVARLGRRELRSRPFTLRAEEAPEDWPDCSVTFGEATVEDDSEEVICTNGVRAEISEGVFYCFDLHGRPRWALRHPAGARLRVLEPLSGGGFASISMANGMVSLFDERNRFLTEHAVLRFEGQTRFVHEYIDPHEVIELREGPWAGALAVLTIAVDLVQTSAGEELRQAFGILVFDPDSLDVLWDWSGHGALGDSQTIDPALDYERLGPSSEDHENFMHANALVHRVEEDGAQRFLMSLRHQDQIIAIDVDSDRILWRLGYQGDFELVDDLDAASPTPLPRGDWFYAQHAPRWIDGGARPRVLLFDNGNNRPDSEQSWSRALELELDFDQMRAAPVFSWGSSDPSAADFFFGDGGGSVELLPGGEIIQVMKGWDAAMVARLSYPDGELLWRWDCVDPEGVHDEPYRARALPSLYEWGG